jgi:hypothetical protein
VYVHSSPSWLSGRSLGGCLRLRVGREGAQGRDGACGPVGRPARRRFSRPTRPVTTLFSQPHETDLPPSLDRLQTSGLTETEAFGTSLLRATTSERASSSPPGLLGAPPPSRRPAPLGSRPRRAPLQLTLTRTCRPTTPPPRLLPMTNATLSPCKSPLLSSSLSPLPNNQVQDRRTSHSHLRSEDTLGSAAGALRPISSRHSRATGSPSPQSADHPSLTASLPDCRQEGRVCLRAQGYVVTLLGSQPAG